MALNTDLPVLLFGQLDDTVVPGRLAKLAYGYGFGSAVGDSSGYGGAPLDASERGSGLGDYIELWDTED